MKQKISSTALISIFAISLLLACTRSNVYPVSASGDTLSALHTSGTKIYDVNNREVRLNVAGIQYGGTGEQITLTDIQKIESMGFNAIRLGIYWNLIQPGSIPPTVSNPVDTAYFESTGDVEPAGIGLDSIVNWASQNNLYIILNPVWTPSYPVPTWARVLPGTYVTTSGDSYPPTGNNPADVPSNCWSDLLHSSTVQSGINLLYSWMSDHYASYNNVVFESFNELVTYATFTSESPPIYADIQNFNNGWVSAIESGEGSNSYLKIIEYYWNWDWLYNYQFAPFIAGYHTNIVMATHDYHSVDETHIPHNYSQTLTPWANAAHSSIATNNGAVPIVDTEWGPFRQEPISNWQPYFQDLLPDFNAVSYEGWAYFAYCSLATQHIWKYTDPYTWNLNDDSYATAWLDNDHTITVLEYLQEFMKYQLTANMSVPNLTFTVNGTNYNNQVWLQTGDTYSITVSPIETYQQIIVHGHTVTNVWLFYEWSDGNTDASRQITLGNTLPVALYNFTRYDGPAPLQPNP